MRTFVDILIIDIECTCNDDPQLPKEQVEIIEIGAVVCRLSTDSFAVLDTLQLYVQPSFTKKLTDFCTQLTGIEQLQVNSAPLLDSALDTFADWLSAFQLSTWMSWGKFDDRQFSYETQLKNLKNPLGSFQHLNLKQLFARKRGHRVGLGRAIQLSGLEFKGRHHSGLDDAKNIAQLLGNDQVLREAVLSRVK